MKPDIKPTKAFTLVEIAVVVTIMALLLAIAIPRWDRMIDSTTLSSAQNRLHELMATAQGLQAMNRSSAIELPKYNSDDLLVATHGIDGQGSMSEVSFGDGSDYRLDKLHVFGITHNNITRDRESTRLNTVIKGQIIFGSTMLMASFGGADVEGRWVVLSLENEAGQTRELTIDYLGHVQFGVTAPDTLPLDQRFSYP